MKAIITIEKSFDDGRTLTKDWVAGDLEEFFRQEGEYLDRLCGVLDKKGKAEDDFTVAYIVNVYK